MQRPLFPQPGLGGPRVPTAMTNTAVCVKPLAELVLLGGNRHLPASNRQLTETSTPSVSFAAVTANSGNSHRYKLT